MVPENEFRFDKIFGGLPEALASVMGTSRSLGQALLPFADCASFQELAEAAEFLLEEDRMRRYCTIHITAHSFLYETMSGKNTVEFVSTEDGGVRVRYTVLSKHSAGDSSAVKAFMEAGWLPDFDTYRLVLQAAAGDYREEEEFSTHAPMHRRRR